MKNKILSLLAAGLMLTAGLLQAAPTVWFTNGRYRQARLASLLPRWIPYKRAKWPKTELRSFT